MRESTLMILHYATAVFIILFGAVHLATHSFLWVGGYPESLVYSAVVAKYRDVLLALSLEGLLITVAYHGLNGVRAILLEISQDSRWKKATTWLLLAVGVVIVAYGTRTVIGAQFLEATPVG